jgi:hypothetical protein
MTDFAGNTRSIYAVLSSVRFFTPSGNSINSLFKCVRVLSAFFGSIVRSMWAEIGASLFAPFSK